MLWMLLAATLTPCEERFNKLMDRYADCLQGCSAWETTDRDTELLPQKPTSDCESSLKILESLGRECCGDHRL